MPQLLPISIIPALYCCSTISKVQVDMVKGVVDAPKEFFTQFASELSEMFKIGMDNLKKTRK